MDLKGIGLADQLRMIQGVEDVSKKSAPGAAPQKVGQSKSFAEFLSQQVSDANQAALGADKAVERAVAGEEANPHSTMIALQKAEITFTLLMAIKDRIEQAYQQLLRMQIG